MYTDLIGKRVLITGASKGIGAATARRLAAEGCDLVAVARTEADLKTLKQDIESETGRRVEWMALDLADAGSAKVLAREFPDIDVLVNNAGDDPAGRLNEIDDATWRRAWETKGFAYVNMCREFYPLMQQRGGGVIVNVIGIAHFLKAPGYIMGAVSTAALSAFTQTLGGASMQDNIRVIGVNPGVTATTRLLRHRRLGDEIRADAGDTAAVPHGDGDVDEARAHADRVAQGLGRPRSADPSEIAAVIAFAVSGEASYLSGISLNVDGGIAKT